MCLVCCSAFRQAPDGIGQPLAAFARPAECNVPVHDILHRLQERPAFIDTGTAPQAIGKAFLREGVN